MKCHDTRHLYGHMWSWARSYRNPQESLHKPHDDAVAQVIHRIILIALIVRLTHLRFRLSAMLSVKVDIEWEKLAVRHTV